MNISKGGWLVIGWLSGFVVGAFMGIFIATKNFNVPEIKKQQTELTVRISKLDSQKFDLAVRMERLKDNFQLAMAELIEWFNENPDKVKFDLDENGYLIQVFPGDEK